MSRFSRLLNRPYSRQELTEINNFWEKAWLKPKFRQSLVETFTKLKQSVGEAWEMSEEELKANNLDREVMVSLAESAAKYLTKLNEIEEKMARVKQFKPRSVLYRQRQGRKLLLEGENLGLESGVVSTVTLGHAPGLAGTPGSSD